MSPDVISNINGQLTEMRSILLDIVGRLDHPIVTREFYSVEETAKLFERDTYTIREWCRQGRIYARKRAERRGGAALWSIAAEEVNRIKNEGLLPPDPGRNR